MNYHLVVAAFCIFSSLALPDLRNANSGRFQTTRSIHFIDKNNTINVNLHVSSERKEDAFRADVTPALNSTSTSQSYNTMFANTTNKHRVTKSCRKIFKIQQNDSQSEEKLTVDSKVLSTTPALSTQMDPTLRRPETEINSLTRNTTPSLIVRRKRYDYEDDSDYNYDIPKFEVDENSREAMISVLAKNWRTLLLKLLVGLCLFCCCCLCCFMWCKNTCRLIYTCCFNCFQNCTVVCRKLGCMRDDPVYNQLNTFTKALGVELDYETFCNMKETIREAMEEQGLNMEFFEQTFNK